MANLPIKDAAAGTVYVGATGAGTSGDPYFPVHKLRGAATLANGQVALSTTAATLVAARTGRRNVTIKNLDAAINIFIGIATVTAGNGYRLGPGESVTLETTALIQGIAASGTPNAAYLEAFD